MFECIENQIENILSLQWVAETRKSVRENNRKFPDTVMSHALKCLNVNIPISKKFKWNQIVYTIYTFEKMWNQILFDFMMLSIVSPWCRGRQSLSKYLYWEEFCKRLIRNPSYARHFNMDIFSKIPFKMEWFCMLVTVFHLFMNQTEVRLFSHDGR